MATPWICEHLFRVAPLIHHFPMSVRPLGPTSFLHFSFLPRRMGERKMGERKIIKVSPGQELITTWWHRRPRVLLGDCGEPAIMMGMSDSIPQSLVASDAGLARAWLAGGGRSVLPVRTIPLVRLQRAEAGRCRPPWRASVWQRCDVPLVCRKPAFPLAIPVQYSVAAGADAGRRHAA